MPKERSITETPGKWEEKKSEMENADLLLLVHGISQQDLVNHLTSAEADIQGMICTGVAHGRETSFKKTLSVPALWPGASHLTPK